MVKQEVISELSSKAALTSSTATGILGLTFNEMIATAGLVCTIVTLLINLYYKERMARIAEANLKDIPASEISNKETGHEGG